MVLDFVDPEVASAAGVNLTQQLCDTLTDSKASVPQVEAVSVISPLVAIAAVSLRFYANWKRGIRWTAADWTVLGALIPSVTFCVMVLIGTAVNSSHPHEIKVPANDTVSLDHNPCLDEIAGFEKNGFYSMFDITLGNGYLVAPVGIIFYVTSLAMVKSSILLIYLKVFVTRSMEVIVSFGLVFMVIFGLSFITPAAYFIHMVHVEGIWSLSQDTLRDFNSLLVALGIVNMISDIVLFMIPTPFILRLQTSKERKVQLIIIFSIGAFCIISSIIRLVFVTQYWRATVAVAADDDSDLPTLSSLAAWPLPAQQYYWRNGMLWSFIEPCTSILCACLPSYKFYLDAASRSLRSVRSSHCSGSNAGFRLLHSPGAGDGRGAAAAASEEKKQPHAFVFGRDRREPFQPYDRADGPFIAGAKVVEVNQHDRHDDEDEEEIRDRFRRSSSRARHNVTMTSDLAATDNDEEAGLLYDDRAARRHHFDAVGKTFYTEHTLP